MEMSNQQLLGRLQIQSSAGNWDTLPLYQSTFKLGRSKSNNIILDDTMVSSQHAQLSFTREGWLVWDLNSTNGTFVNDEQIPPGKVIARSHIPVERGKIRRLKFYNYTQNYLIIPVCDPPGLAILPIYSQYSSKYNYCSHK